MCVPDCSYEITFVFGCIFFFQAEDGIRDLVRSRGLGDVYKRQAKYLRKFARRRPHLQATAGGGHKPGGGDCLLKTPVSYTHLTLPTSDLV